MIAAAALRSYSALLLSIVLLYVGSGRISYIVTCSSYNYVLYVSLRVYYCTYYEYIACCDIHLCTYICVCEFLASGLYSI